MKVSTMILRHPFGVSNVAFASEMYGAVDVWAKAKEKREVEHRRDVAEAVRGVPGSLLGVTSGYREHHGTDVDGRTAEWWSVVIYDGPPLP